MNEDFIAKLREMRKLIAKGWTQELYARDGAGRYVDPSSRRAECWCLMGAADRAGLPPWDFFKRGRHINVAKWNDAPGRTQAEVLACIDNSIKALEEA